MKLFLISLEDEKNLDVLEISSDDIKLIKMYLQNRGFIKLDRTSGL